MNTTQKCKQCQRPRVWKHGYCVNCVDEHEHIARQVEALDEQEKKIQAGVEAFSRLVNNIGLDAETIAQQIVAAFGKEHPTLQQSMIRVLSLSIKKYSQSYSDLRNSAAVGWAKKVSELDDFFPFV